MAKGRGGYQKRVDSCAESSLIIKLLSLGMSSEYR